ncbi:hypothetical protein B0H11DRAFT_2219278 [Mycena galericulata]|nr:hypothetical protein B0H11DRAFT_2219278 [Mycena galericulata]
MLSFLFGFLFGVVSTVASGWAFGIVPSKTGSAVVSTSSVSAALVFVLVNVLVLDIVLLLPSIGSAVGLVKKVKATLFMLFTRRSPVKPAPTVPPVPDSVLDRLLVVEGRRRHASDASLMPVAVLLVVMFHLELINKAATSSPSAFAVLTLGEDPEHAMDEQVKVPGAYEDTIKLKEFGFGVLSLAICVCIASSFIAWDVISGLVGVLSFGFAHARNMYRSKNRLTLELDEEADITLVDESELPVKTLLNHSPLVPFCSATLPTSKSAPVLSYSVHERPRLRASTTSLQLVGGLSLSPAVNTSVSAASFLSTAESCAPPTALNPAIPAFVPAARASAVSPAQAAGTAPSSPKQDWVPTAPLSFAWARGGCATRLTAPRPPPPTTLKADAPAFVPKTRPAALPAPVCAPVTKLFALRGTPPSFWAPGGRAIPIVPPQDALSKSV